jgi:hypothetical protein
LAHELISIMLARVEVARRQIMNNGEHDPSDEGAPPGAPRPIKLTPEQLAQFRAAINEAEVLEELREAQAGGGRTLDQFIGELEELARQLQDKAASKG